MPTPCRSRTAPAGAAAACTTPRRRAGGAAPNESSRFARRSRTPLAAQRDPDAAVGNVLVPELGVAVVERVFDDQRDFAAPAPELDLPRQPHVDAPEAALRLAVAAGAEGRLQVQVHARIPVVADML